MAFWNRVDEPLRRFLDRVETLEPTWTLYNSSSTRDGVLESAKIAEDSLDNYLGHTCEKWVIANSKEDWAITMAFRQQTPDGELTTTIWSLRESCLLNVKMGKVFLELLQYRATSVLDDGKLSRYDVRYVRDWVRQRALPALEVAQRRRLERQAREKQEQAAKVGALRDKYLS